MPGDRKSTRLNSSHPSIPSFPTRRSSDLAETLHRHRDRHDHLAAVVDAHHAGVQALQGLADLRITAAVLRPELLVERQVAAAEPAAQRDKAAFDNARRSEEHTSELQSPVHPLFPYTTLFRSRGNAAPAPRPTRSPRRGR